MIPAQNTSTQTDNMLGLEEVEFSIGDPRWVMRTQADLYSNRELAVAREYSTNAFDANKEKALEDGTEVEPIEVSLPSLMSPYFKVKDSGKGMSRRVLTSVYTEFGTSTKRDSNEFNGMMGYGSKSAVAYTPQFTVTSVHEGMKTVAVITRRPDWSIGLKVMAHTATDEPSGTEVVVPVSNASEFSTKAMDFYRFWRTGTVLIDGKFHDSLATDKFFDNFYNSPSLYSYIVMGNAPYRIENVRELFADTGITPFPFIAYVDTGEVEFTPNREALKYTEQTVKVLKEIVEEFADKVKAKAKSEIENAESHAQAYERWSYWSKHLGHVFLGTLNYKGDALVNKFDIDGYQYVYAARGRSYRVNSWLVADSSETLFVTSMPSIPPSAGQKSKAEEYRSTKVSQARKIAFIKEPTVPSPWVDNDASNVVSWEALKAALPKAPTRAKTGKTKDIKGSFEVYLHNSGYGSEMEIPDDYEADKWFYVTAHERTKVYNIVSIRSYLPSGIEANIVVVGANRLDKFKRDYSDIEPFIEFAQSHVVKDGASMLSDEEKALMSLSYYDTRWLGAFGPYVFDDPEVNNLVALYSNRPDTTDNEYNRNLNLARHAHVFDVEEYDNRTDSDFFEERYPLLERMNAWSQGPESMRDIVLYMNAKYKSLNDSEDEDE